MVVPDKKLRPGELRFEVKKIDKLWRVYDKVRGSFPYANKDLGGKVAQDLPEKEAQAEAERLNKKFVPEMAAAPGAKSSAKKTSPEAEHNSKTVQAADLELEMTADTSDGWIDESQIPDYGVLDDETAKKYVEGIL